MIYGVTTQYAFHCKCGQIARMLEPDYLICPNCGEFMELVGVRKTYPGFGIGTMTIKKFFQYERRRPPLDDEDQLVV